MLEYFKLKKKEADLNKKLNLLNKGHDPKNIINEVKFNELLTEILNVQNEYDLIFDKINSNSSINNTEDDSIH